MNGSTPFLALAIEARIDGNGRMVAADPHLTRLHKQNGGVEAGVLAIPQLLELANLAWRTGAKIERAVIIADGEADVELWVSAVRETEFVLLSISGWQEISVRRNAAIATAPPIPGGGIAPGDASILLDSKAAIISVAPQFLDLVGVKNIGWPIGNAFEGLDGIDSGALDSADEIAVRMRNDGSPVRLAFARIIDAGGAALGFECRIYSAADMAEPAAPEAVDDNTNIGFGRQFASAVRQPLSRIIANAETIGAHVNGPIKENYAGYAQDIASAARHLSELVSDLEDLDAIDRDDFKVAAETVELGDIARRVAGLLALKAADHHINIELPASSEKIEVVGEFRRILQIVLNLVGNAIRYAPDGSTVRIAIGASPASLSVSDQGRGIPFEERERVFEKFERLGRSGDGGSGLGLYISRRLARAMKGDLVVDDSEEGGAMFTLSLPPFESA